MLEALEKQDRVSASTNQLLRECINSRVESSDGSDFWIELIFSCFCFHQSLFKHFSSAQFGFKGAFTPDSPLLVPGVHYMRKLHFFCCCCDRGNASLFRNGRSCLREPGQSKNVQYSLQLVWIEVGSCSHQKQTATEFVWKRAETTSSNRSQSACLVHFWCTSSSPAAFTPAQTNCTRREKRTEVRLNGTREGWCESAARISGPA